MPLPEVSYDLLPCVDFPESRRTLTRLYVAAGALFVTLLVTLLSANVDVVVDGDAVIVPFGETARVQCRAGGVVDEIAVHDGDHVTKGQVLVRLDGARVRDRVRVLTAELEAASARVELLEQGAAPRSESYRIQQKVKLAEARSVSARRDAARALLAARSGAQEFREADRKRAEWLFGRDVQAKVDVDTAAVQAELAAAEAAAARANIRELDSSQDGLRLEVSRLGTESRLAELSDAAELAKARAEKERLAGELSQAQIELSQLDVVAPRSGVIQGLSVHDRGDVLANGAVVAHAVPEDEELVLSSEVPGTGMGFIREGQRARVKLDPYPFQDFGIFYGAVTRVADDSKRGETGGGSPKYVVRVRLLAPPVDRSGAVIPLHAGMTARVEFIVRRERLLLSLIRPLRGTLGSVRN